MQPSKLCLFLLYSELYVCYLVGGVSYMHNSITDYRLNTGLHLTCPVTYYNVRTKNAG